MNYVNIDPSLEYDEQELALQRAEARIKALRGMHPSPYPGPGAGFTSAVTKTTIPGRAPKPRLGGYLGMLSPLVSDYVSGKMEEDVAGERVLSSARQDADIQKAIEEKPKPLAPSSELDVNAQPTGRMLPPVPVPFERNLEWARKMSRFPKTRSGLVQKMLEDELIKQREREQQTEVERFKLLHQAGEKDLDRKNAIRAAEIRSGDRRNERPVSLGGKAYLLRDPDAPGGWRQVDLPEKPEKTPTPNYENLGPDLDNPEMDRYLDKHDPTKPPVLGAAKYNNLPVGMGERFASNNAAIHQVDEVVKLLNTPEGRHALGPTRSTLARIPGPYGEWVLNNWLDPKGTVTRAMVTAIGSTKLHTLSGATVTAAEETRFKPYIPSVGDSYQTAAQKLWGFRQEYQKMQQEYIDYAKSQRYRSPGTVPAAPMAEQPTNPNQIPGGVPGSAAPAKAPTVVREGTAPNGRRVQLMSDGKTRYVD